MKTLYLECNMGAAGDMLAAALLELTPDPVSFVRRLNGIGIPGVEFHAEALEKCGIQCTHMSVKVDGEEEESLDDHNHDPHHHDHGHDHDHHDHDHHDHGHGHDHAHDPDHAHDHDHHHDHGEAGDPHDHPHHAHHSFQDIERLVSHLRVAESVRADILAVYRLIAEAESHAHGVPVEEIHFHEVGAMDAVADIAAVCLLLHELAPERICASAVHVGSGNVRCAHGIVPVPAPAAAYLLRDIPTYGGEVRGELCTPTGAALLRHFVRTFGAQPVMRVEKIGYGAGKKDFERANCLRAMLGECAESGQSVESGQSGEAGKRAESGQSAEAGESAGRGERVLELRCNLDDMTAEAVGFAMERLFAAGALDVFTTPVGMKKDRPGVLLTCICAEGLREKMVRQMFLHTTTLGIRENVCARYTLERSTESAETARGPVRWKRASGWGVVREKAEFEDLARIARADNLSLEQVSALVQAQRGKGHD